MRELCLCRLSDTLDELLPEAFATVREASRRVLGMRHFDSQLVGESHKHPGAVGQLRRDGSNSNDDHYGSGKAHGSCARRSCCGAVGHAATDVPAS